MRDRAFFPIMGLLIGFSLLSCFGWQGRPLVQQSQSLKNRAMSFGKRRDYLGLVSSSFIAGILSGEPKAMASNLPVPTGADVSKVGTLEKLVPIVALRSSLEQLKSQLTEPSFSKLTIDASLPRDETAFKKLFDAYSDPVSYKQKFLDQNAFLVYYTKGFDGPGRASIEADMNERQTQQFGFRNEAWIAWENFLSETAFIKDEDNDCIAHLNATIQAIDSYIMLAPVDDVQLAKSQVGMSS